MSRKRRLWMILFAAVFATSLLLIFFSYPLLEFLSREYDGSNSYTFWLPSMEELIPIWLGASILALFSGTGLLRLIFRQINE